MESFLNAVQAVSVILLLTATGYLCGAKGWMKGESKAFLSKFLLSVAVPCMCVYGIRANLTREMLAESLRPLAVPFLCNTVSVLASFLLARLLKLPRKQLGVFVVMCSFSNAMFIGYAMCLELFGEACVPYVMLYYFASICFNQTLGMGLIRWSGESGQGKRRNPLRFLATPAVLGLLTGVAMVALDLQPPSFLASYLRYISGVVSPVALLLTGYIIYELGLDKLRIDRPLAVALAYRFLAAPATYAVCCALLGVRGLARDTLLVEAAMPVLTQTVVGAAEYGADEQLAARGAAITTLSSFVVVPVLMMLL